jgi:hypothetical protein
MQITKLQVAIIVTVMGMVLQTKAQLFNISFTGGVSAGNGQIDVVDGIAISGYFNVTEGANQGTYNLVSLTSPLINGDPVGDTQTLVISGNDQIFDDVVTPNSNPFLTDDGLEFANNDSIGFNLWGNSPGSYDLFDADNVYVIDSGIATIAPAPEPATVSLVAGGLLGLLALRRRKA